MIREANENDLMEILEIYNYAILNTTAIYAYEPHDIEERKQWYYERKQNNHPVIVFEEDDKVVGFATFEQFRAYPAYKYSLEHSVYVHKDYRKRGIGKKLMKKLIEVANEQGYAIMVAAIDSENSGSIELHKKLGFEYAGTIEKSGFKFGKWLDLVFYELKLRGPENPIESD
ncbi:GNAT family N-acetyltransferase [Clostridium guangxiense]|uniref:GNAT family N-acetyltransferase n=1 Tax=Clostridium guangxiense TaxID=1662055 RepID=UPI001E55D5A7|nr:GNAT family N-acetyltransferase [Clostridium guangxiense]MCD2348949.1 N-acetyltransferase family protein [Clostridium guangxiense]